MDVGQALPRFGGFPHSKRRPARRRDVGGPKSAGGSTHDLTGVFVKPSKETMLFLCLFAAPGPTCKRSCGWLPPVPVRNSRRFKNTPGFLQGVEVRVETADPGMCDFPFRRESGTGNRISSDFFAYFLVAQPTQQPSTIGLARMAKAQGGTEQRTEAEGRLRTLARKPPANRR